MVCGIQFMLTLLLGLGDIYAVYYDAQIPLQRQEFMDSKHSVLRNLFIWVDNIWGKNRIQNEKVFLNTLLSPISYNPLRETGHK